MYKCILPSCITDNYNVVALKTRVSEIFSLFDYFKLIDNSIELPKITANYKVMYSQRLTYIKSSKIEDFVIRKIMIDIRSDDESRKRLLTKISIALKSLTELEAKVFKLYLFDNKNEEDISYDLGYCLDNIRAIKKSSFIRFLVCLGVDKDCFN